MPTYKITGPDGKVYRVTGEGTAEEALAQVQARVGGTQTAAAPQPVPPPAAESSVLGDLGQGVKASLDRTALGLKGMLPRSVQAWGDNLDASMGNKPLTLENATKAPGSTAGTVGDIGGEVLQTLVPGGGVLKGAKALQKALGATRFAGAALPAALAADAAGNAGISAAMAPENRGEAAAWGAGGSLAGAGAARVLGGAARKLVTPQAQQLIDAGIPLTPGQAMSGGGASGIANRIRGLEDSLTSLPIMGDVIKTGQAKALKAFNTQRINDAISGIGGKVDVPGIEGLAKADTLISDTYDRVLPDIFVPRATADTAIKNAYLSMSQMPLFDANHDAKLAQWIERRIEPLAANGAAAPIDGATAKAIDSELGELGRKYKASGIGNEPLGQAFMDLRQAWRNSMQGTTPEARQTLKEADKAYAKLLPLQESGNKSVTGVFTPKQLADSLRKLKMPEDPLAQAGRQVLPNSVPDSGTAGRQILANALHPAIGAGAVGGAALAGWSPLALAGMSLAGAYSPTGFKGLTKGVHPLAEALRSKLGRPGPYNPDLTEEALRNLIGRSVSASGTE